MLFLGVSAAWREKSVSTNPSRPSGHRDGLLCAAPILKLMNPLMKGLLATDILVRFCEQIPYAFVKALIMDLSPDSCKAGMFGLYYLIRDVCVAIAALGGAFLWQISPPTNLVTAFFFGLIGTVGFWIVGRDIQVPANKEESMGE
jgi:hypothetical protein